MSERKMATIRRIDEIGPIPDADAIEVATVGGWKVVVKKGEFTPGQLAVYCEIDSFIPTAIAPFLTKPGHFPKTYEGVEGERLKTVRLRGQLSQGLLLPLEPTCSMIESQLIEGLDVSLPLGIVKYEAPVPACLAGEVEGMFPGYLPKTDQERIQNLTEELEFWQAKEFTWEVTEKLDGSSMTVFLNDGEFGVCSRNLHLKFNKDNTLCRVALKADLEAKLRAIGRNLALQGELIGESIQGNKYQMKGQEFYIFDIYDIDAKRYLTPAERAVFVIMQDMKHVPVLESGASLGEMDELLNKAIGKSVMGMIGCEREGLVFKCNQCEASFKSISNKFLIKHGE